MVKVVGVRFKAAGKIYYFDPCDLDINSNDFVVVETARGIEFGHVALGPKFISEKDIVSLSSLNSKLSIENPLM